jgi:hypothetical protein
MSAPQLALYLRPRERRLLTIASTVVSTMVAWGAVDLALRLLPTTWFHIPDAEVARRWHSPEAPFLPNVTVRSTDYRGDESRAGNIPPLETRGPRTFSTDSLGFRFTPPVHPGRPPEIVVLRGFSYAWGSQLDDHETFSAVLAKQLGVNVYCGARLQEDRETPSDVASLFRRIGAEAPVALYLHLEELGANRLSAPAPRAVDRIGTMLGGARYESVMAGIQWARFAIPTWFSVSPLDSMVIPAVKSIKDDRILGNPYREKLVSFPLPDGGRLLHRAEELKRVQNPPGADAVVAQAAYIEKWALGLARIGARPLAVLVPEKMSVYGPALGVVNPDNAYLNNLERELLKRGVETVNLLPTLRAGAQRDLETGRLAFYREDHHWSPDGVSRMAALTAAEIRRAGMLTPPGGITRASNTKTTPDTH